MAECVLCSADAAFGAGGYCLRCWDAAENYRANTFQGNGTYLDYIRALAAAQRPARPGGRRGR